MTKKVIIICGIFGVGKSYYCEKFVENHKEFTIVPCDTDINKTIGEIKKHDYVIMDYYFNSDWNANKLRKELKCPVMIKVLFDDPEIITGRQIFHKPMSNNSRKDCFCVYKTYMEDLRHLIRFEECVFTNSSTMEQYLWADFKEVFRKYYERPGIDKVKKFVDKIESIQGYDKHYHHINLPWNIIIGKDNYARNEKTWMIIKDWIEWNNKKVLDLACFHGYFSQQIWMNGGYPTGCDRHPYAIHSAGIIAKMFGMDITFFHYDIDEGFPIGNYDTALLFNVFHHLKNKIEVLKRLQNYDKVIFEINETDKSEILKYFNAVKEAKSPKDNRIIMLCEAKK